jgi:DNA (cytosine-5)-methyltransferase 1
VPIYEDVRDVGDRQRTGEGPERDHSQHLTPAGRLRNNGEGSRIGDGSLHLLCGGFPCQDVSVAGRRTGLAGARSGLFHEFARIAESLRPRWLLVENVPGLLSSNGGRDFGVVLGTLADIGYGVAWRIVDSRFFGVPQRRRRVFVLGALSESDTRGAAERAGQVLAVGTRCPGHPATRSEARQDSSLALGDGSPISGTLGNASGTRDWKVSAEDAAENKLLSFALTTSQERLGDGTQETFVQQSGVRRLTPTECERLQALPDGWTDFGPDSRRYAALGDAVTASVGEWIGVRLLSGEATRG